MLHTENNNGIQYLQSDVFPAGVRHGFSTRLGGVSPAPWDSLNLGVSRGDTMDNVRENYRLFCGALGVTWDHCVLSQQEHLDTVYTVTADDWGKGLTKPRTYNAVDALITNTPDTPLTVFGADCNVILLYDPMAKAIGAAHAGWRGTVLNIAGQTVSAMCRQFGCQPENMVAALGPSIGPCCFETDSDVPAALREVLGDKAAPFIQKQGEKYHIDLKGVNALWLCQAGVQTVDVSDLCTKCRTDLFWSHRFHGNDRGVQVGMIALEESL